MTKWWSLEIVKWSASKKKKGVSINGSNRRNELWGTKNVQKPK
jgi:hypothetical protein